MEKKSCSFCPPERVFGQPPSCTDYRMKIIIKEIQSEKVRIGSPKFNGKTFSISASLQNDAHISSSILTVLTYKIWEKRAPGIFCCCCCCCPLAMRRTLLFPLWIQMDLKVRWRSTTQPDMLYSNWPTNKNGQIQSFLHAEKSFCFGVYLSCAITSLRFAKKPCQDFLQLYRITFLSIAKQLWWREKNSTLFHTTHCNEQKSRALFWKIWIQ